MNTFKHLIPKKPLGTHNPDRLAVVPLTVEHRNKLGRQA